MPTDTQVNDLKINVLSEAQYEQIQSPSATELYLVPETVDTTPTSGSTNPITSGGVYSALQNLPSQEQSDWNETDTTDPAYIKNKPQNLVTDANYVHTDNNYTTTEKNKLAGVASGAEVNVQSDWNQTDNTEDDFIKNKPTIPSAPGTLTTNATASQTASAGEAMSGNITLHKVSKTGSYEDLNDKPTITDVKVRQTRLSSGTTEYPVLLSSDSNPDLLTPTAYESNFTTYMTSRSDGSLVLKIGTADNTEDTPSLFFRRGSASNAGTDWAIRSIGVESGTDTPLQFLRRYGSGSSTWVTKLSISNSGIITNVTNGITANAFVTNGGTSSQVVRGDGTLGTVVTIFSGSSAPSSNVGNDGDIYIQTAS